ncbi:MAG: glycosyltransferase family 2 protein [bacterium]
MNRSPRITFGMIVLNGEPFVRYNLQAIYPFAHQIIVVEGAVDGAKAIASPDGHSNDGTLERLREFKAKHDAQKKITIVTAEDEGYPNGFWPNEKDEMSQAYARRAAGDYLWHIDVDEFYRPEDMQRMLDLLRDNPHITALSFKMITFWGGFRHTVDGWYLRRGAEIYHRVFKWGKGYRLTTHRPPTVVNSQRVDLRKVNWVNGHQLAAMGIYLYHYSLVFQKQVFEKCQYYKEAEWAKKSKALDWANDVYLQLKYPYRVHNVYEYPSWLEKYRGKHPAAIKGLIRDLEAGKVHAQMRSMEDVEKLLNNNIYRVGRLVLKIADYPSRVLAKITHRRGRFFERS